MVDSGSGGTELGRYLRARRELTSPASVGLPPSLARRRTPGLRREELAALAGVSIDYYIRLERGRESRPSPEVVDSLARALRLDDEEWEHLRSVAALAARRPSDPPSPPTRSVAPGVGLLLEGMRPLPAHVAARNGDLLAWNPGGLRLLAGIEDWPASQRNVWRYTFLHPMARTLFDDWQAQLRGCVRYLRALSALEPDAPDLAAIVGELLLKSSDFAKIWDRYDLAAYSRKSKTFHHPEVGTLTLGYQSMHLEGTRGQSLIAYWATPGSPEHDSLVLLDRAVVDQPVPGYADSPVYMPLT